ncbi:MAG: dynamin family protein [Oscillospiraceae bacterium]|nr:dynamin family protein [Oscillospiraceae bacterium]
MIGQVKAGKSTFLNTLLFDGKKILPSARTPKTAVLTKIEYDENNSLYIDYYTKEEWKCLEKCAKSDLSTDEYRVAKEIMEMAEANHIDALSYCERGSEKVEFDSYEELMGKLNDYVGENGTYTPVVKNVTIRMSKPELKDICVIDTPGLNDAIASRTDKTREFMSKCDVVFFLSRASQFIDANDMMLVSSQLPQKGVKKIMLICSQFDMGILDVLKKAPDIRHAMNEVSTKLTEHAKNVFNSKSNVLEENVLAQFRKPVFISSIAYNLSMKDEKDWSEDERYSVKKLIAKGADKKVLHEIGNIDVVKQMFDQVISDKDATLMEKAADFVPNAKKQWDKQIQELRDYVNNTLNKLKTEDKDSLLKQKNMIQSQVAEIDKALEDVLGGMILDLEASKADCLRDLRKSARDNTQLQEKQATEWHSRTVTKYAHHFLFFKWGRYEDEERYSTSYSYLAAADALENVRQFGYDACSGIERIFTDTVDLKRTKTKLTQTILDNFDTSDENFDITTYRHIIESTLNRVDFPIIKMDVSQYINRISGSFSGEVRDSSDRDSLRRILGDVIDGMFSELENILMKEVVSFKEEIDKMKKNFGTVITQNLLDECDKLIKQLDNKEAEIHAYEEAAVALKSV